MRQVIKAPSLLTVQQVHRYTGHTQSIYDITHGKESGTFYSAGGDGILALWEVDRPDEATLFARVPSQIFSLALIPDHDLLIAGQMQGGIHVMDLKTKKEIRFLTFHDQSIYHLHYDQPNQRLLASSGNGILSVWSVPDFELLYELKLAGENIRTAISSPDGSEIAVGCSDNHLVVLDADSLKVKYRVQAHENSVFSLCYDRPGNRLFSGSRDAYLKVWDVGKKYELSHAIPAHLFTINDLVLSPNGRWLASAGRDKEVRIWDVDTYKLLKVLDKDKFDGHVNSVNRLLWMEDPELLISVSDDRSIIAWKVED